MNGCGGRPRLPKWSDWRAGVHRFESPCRAAQGPSSRRREECTTQPRKVRFWYICSGVPRKGCAATCCKQRAYGNARSGDGVANAPPAVRTWSLKVKPFSGQTDSLPPRGFFQRACCTKVCNAQRALGPLGASKVLHMGRLCAARVLKKPE